MLTAAVPFHNLDATLPSEQVERSYSYIVPTFFARQSGRYFYLVCHLRQMPLLKIPPQVSKPDEY
jgi:hypothetical protein